jgi:isopenicillin-N N-acyltransferase like protein
MAELRPTQLTVLRLRGSHRQIGRDYGEALREPIRRHLDMVLQRLGQSRGFDAAAAREQAQAYRTPILRHAAFFDEEIQGLAEGAGLAYPDALLLQLRAELNPSRSLAQPADAECTTFAALPPSTANGAIFAGQVPDLPLSYAGLGVVLEIAVPGEPALLMFTPAGQLSYIGINDRGLCCFANYLHCDGWRLGVPRYFLSRLALACDTVVEALERVRSVPRASSRNLLLADRHGHAVDLETTVDRDAELLPENGVLAHANHYVSAALRGEERGSDAFLTNSRRRHERMEALLLAGHGRLDAATLQAAMRDRDGAPDCISRAPNDGEAGVQSVAAVLASPTQRQLWVAEGPPHLHAFEQVHFSAGGGA